MRKPITISIETEIVKKIDNTKGKNEPRSRFIEDIISEFLIKKRPKTPKTRPSERELEIPDE